MKYPCILSAIRPYHYWVFHFGFLYLLSWVAQNSEVPRVYTKSTTAIIKKNPKIITKDLKIPKSKCLSYSYSLLGFCGIVLVIISRSNRSSSTAGLKHSALMESRLRPTELRMSWRKLFENRCSSSMTKGKHFYPWTHPIDQTDSF